MWVLFLRNIDFIFQVFMFIFLQNNMHKEILWDSLKSAAFWISR